VDQTIEITHLSHFDPSLSNRSTPDWEVYCHAAEAGFHAMVTRDISQPTQGPEMYALSRLPAFSVITWRKAIEDPVREWGQLLAYLPEVKKRLRQGGGGVIVLPAPQLGQDNLLDPKDVLGRLASDQKISGQQVRSEARLAIQDWSELIYGDRARFNDLLGLR
jgi:hypothetical protein